MKKIIIPALLLLASACAQVPVFEEPADKEAVKVPACIPQTLFVKMDNPPRTKLTVGDYDPATDSYPLSLGSEYVYVLGTSRDTIAYEPHTGQVCNQTFKMLYYPQTTTDGKTMLCYADGFFSEDDPEYAFGVTKAVCLLPCEPSGLVLSGVYEDDYTPYIFGAKFTMDEFEAFSSRWEIFDESQMETAEEDCWMPLHFMNSLVFVSVDLSELGDNFEVSDISFFSDSDQKPDLDRLNWMLDNGSTVCGKLDDPCWHNSFWIHSRFENGSSYTLGIQPGKYDVFKFAACITDGENEYRMVRTANGPIEFRTSTLYDISFRPTMEKIASMEVRKKSLNLHLGGRMYRFEDAPNVAHHEEYDNIAAINGYLKAGVEIVPVPGAGAPADYSGVDVNGKIALVKRGSITFTQKIATASAHGAVAIIIYNNTSAAPTAMDTRDLQMEEWIPAIMTELAFYDAYHSNPGPVYITDIDEVSRDSNLCVGGIVFPLVANPSDIGTAATLSKFKTLLSHEAVVMAAHSISSADNLSGKIVILEYVDRISRWTDLELLRDKGAAAVILPAGYDFGMKLDVLDTAAHGFGDMCIVSTDASFPFFYKAMGCTPMSVESAPGASLDFNEENINDRFE